jgi:hypothetical protein
VGDVADQSEGSACHLEVGRYEERHRRSEAILFVQRLVADACSGTSGQVRKREFFEFRAGHKADGARMGSPCPLCLASRGREIVSKIPAKSEAANPSNKAFQEFISGRVCSDAPPST